MGRVLARGCTAKGRVTSLITLVLSLVLAFGCTPEKRYRALSVFFDGVPDPNAPSPAAQSAAPDEASSNGPSAQPLVRQGAKAIHEPYSRFQCAKCHNMGPGAAKGAFLVKTVHDGLCADCHKDVPGEARYTHAPVLTLACLECHEPHESRGPGLLLKNTPNVCTRCHRVEDLSTGSHHPSSVPASDAECLRCHDPHGGEKRYFLRGEGL